MALTTAQYNKHVRDIAAVLISSGAIPASVIPPRNVLVPLVNAVVDFHQSPTYKTALANAIRAERPGATAAEIRALRDAVMPILIAEGLD